MSAPIMMNKNEFAWTGKVSTQKGIALVTCLLILVMLVLLALTMFRGFGLQQKIAGNTREKERAYQAAESALQYGEWWLTQDDRGSGVPCTAPPTPATTMRACSSAYLLMGDDGTKGAGFFASDPEGADKWADKIGFSYLPPEMQIGTNGGVVESDNGNMDIFYRKAPSLHVAYMGLSPDGRQKLYTVTGAGYGGSSDSTSVVQSVYATTSKVIDLGQP